MPKKQPRKYKCKYCWELFVKANGRQRFCCSTCREYYKADIKRNGVFVGRFR